MLELLLLLAVVMSGCGSAPRAYHYTDGIGADMAEWIYKYRDDAVARGASMDYSNLEAMVWVPTLAEGDTGLYGLCETHQEPDLTLVSRVTISRATPAWAVRTVIYHELSHCLRGALHVADAAAIMYYEIGTEQQRVSDWDTQVYALFFSPRTSE